MYNSPFPFGKDITGPLNENIDVKEAFKRLDIEKEDIDLIMRDGIDIADNSYLKYLGHYSSNVILDSYYGNILGSVGTGFIGKWGTLTCRNSECPWTGYEIASKNQIIEILEPTKYENAPWGKLPIFIVNSQKQFTGIIRKIQDKFRRNKSKNRLIFRGQNKDWRLKRSEITYKLAYPNADLPIVESSLLPTILRSPDYVINEERLRDIYFSVTYPIEDNDMAKHPFPIRVTSSGLIEHSVNLTLQHYGIPTNCHLDVTYNPEIALWFAIHKIITNDEGITESYVFDYQSDSVDDWPVIFLMIGYESDNLLSTYNIKKMGKSVIYAADNLLGNFGAAKKFEGGLISLRAKRQKCGLLFSSKFHMKNGCYMDVFAKIYLSPEFRYSGGYKCYELFPGPKEDELLTFFIKKGFYPFKTEILQDFT